MNTPIAIFNLWHQGVKTLVSIGGVAFALLLVFMQLGFMGAVSHTATNVLERLKFDVLIRARDYLHLYEAGQIDRKWLSVAQGTEGVREVYPFWVTIHNWRKLPKESEPQDDSFESKYLPIAVMAFEPHYCVFDLAQVETQTPALYRNNSVLIDDSTQADYGPWNGKKFSQADIQRHRTTEIGGSLFQLDGLFQLGTGLASNGAVIMGHEGFARIMPWDVRTTASLGLVDVDSDDPKEIETVIQRLKQRTELPDDGLQPPVDNGISRRIGQWLGAAAPEPRAGTVAILSREQALEREKYRWLWQTPIGLIFQLGVVLSLLVGAAIVYMVLSTDVANRLPEYATLLAMGYSRMYLASIVMTQAMVFGVLGFLSAWGVAEVLYRLTYSVSGIPMGMNLGRVALVSVLGLFMCWVSGLLALRKLWKAEPANLF